MSATDWEGRCRRCGLCCFDKFENDNGAIFYTQTPCRYLDVVTRACRIYEHRFDINTDCIKLTTELVAELHWLPPTCGYRAGGETDDPPAPPVRRRRGRR